MEPPTSTADLEQIFRTEHGRVFSLLLRGAADFDAAEDALQEAFVAALSAWPREGVPAQPAAWLLSVARNRLISRLRHDAVVRRKHAELGAAALSLGRPPAADDELPDERLRLIFTCCHPALGEEARVALTLREMCGLPTAAIARLFLTSEATVAQRLVRAKRKLRDAGIPFEVPRAERLDERTDAVLAVVYLLFTAGYSPIGDGPLVRGELCDEAIRLQRQLCHLMPQNAEAHGLLALMLLHDARRAARADAAGELLTLAEQDRSRWDRRAIGEGTRHLEEALGHGRVGIYQIQAAIAALHANAARAEDTDWPQIAGLYAELFRRQPSPVTALNLAVADGMAHGAEWGLVQLDRFVEEGVLAGCGPVVAARADLLLRAGHVARAAAAYKDAIAHARNDREARFFSRRLASLTP
ncbi:MAG TPA: sigma-70 family RNA polymerase sigma factor [Pseudomonadota bacterium]|nr:sigma-70 family RNA polymerase sigma factor [Pseudomonadota bacterium]